MTLLGVLLLPVDLSPHCLRNLRRVRTFCRHCTLIGRVIRIVSGILPAASSSRKLLIFGVTAVVLQSKSPVTLSFFQTSVVRCCEHFELPQASNELHLIVVDLWWPWKYNTARAREITDQLWYISHGNDTHRVNPFRPDGPEPPSRCRRFAYGYALDGSEYPSYLVWPQRDGQSYILLDTFTTDTLPLNNEFLSPIGYGTLL